MQSSVARSAKPPNKASPCADFVTEAVEDKLKATPALGAKPWMKHLGRLKDFRKETQHIDKVIAETFEKVDLEMWASEKPD